MRNPGLEALLERVRAMERKIFTVYRKTGDRKHLLSLYKVSRLTQQIKRDIRDQKPLPSPSAKTETPHELWVRICKKVFSSDYKPDGK